MENFVFQGSFHSLNRKKTAQNFEQAQVLRIFLSAFAILTKIFKIEPLYISLIVTAIVAALTIGGKALGKGIAIKNSNNILFMFSKIVSFFYIPKK